MFKKRKIYAWTLFVLALMLLYQCNANQNPNLNKITKRFDVTISTENLQCLYWMSSRNFLNAGSCCSVWQCDEDAPLVAQAMQWEKIASLFQSEKFRLTYSDADLDSRWFPEDKETELYWLLEGDTYKELSLGFAPEITLENGQKYKNLLFVVEWYS